MRPKAVSRYSFGMGLDKKTPAIWAVTVFVTCGLLFSLFAVLWSARQTEKIPMSFTLTDHNGVVYHSDREQLYKLVLFGFTHCPDVCPTGIENMHNAMNQVGPLAHDLRPLFITIDPERDSPEVIHAYLENFHPSFLGLTGSSEELKAVQENFHVYAKKVQPPDYDEYVMDHSAHIYLLDKDDIIIDVFDYRMDTSMMIQRIMSKMHYPEAQIIR